MYYILLLFMNKLLFFLNIDVFKHMLTVVISLSLNNGECDDTDKFFLIIVTGSR